MGDSSRWGGYHVVDPHEISCRFTTSEGLSSVDTFLDAMSGESENKIKKIKSVMDKLPPIESDFVHLYFFKKMRQTAIAKIFRVSQPTVCYRLQRAVVRIKFLLEIPDISLEEIKTAITPHLDDVLDIKIMILMAHTTCQSETAKRLGISQGMVRHRFFRSLNKIKAVNNMRRYSEYFDIVSRNLNKMREVSMADSLDPVFRMLD